MERDDLVLTEALGQNEFRMRLSHDMALVCVPDLGWRRVMIRAEHVRGLHRPRVDGVPLTGSVVGLWMSPTMRAVLPCILELDQVAPFGS